VTDAWGRLHDVENVYVGDGSVFVTAGGFNPTLTIMSLSIRMARHIAGSSAPPASAAGAAKAAPGRLAATGGSDAVGAAGAAAVATGLALGGVRRRVQGSQHGEREAGSRRLPPGHPLPDR
jgi:hypothetical protein